ncbi:hypothetical protein B0H14DRAFT_2621788 [Mycena olivaceomarginata]|nr:hypothetical protein B0H14DRAFT_2621788 [Mycena olivaceomarginata]
MSSARRGLPSTGEEPHDPSGAMGHVGLAMGCATLAMECVVGSNCGFGMCAMVAGATTTARAGEKRTWAVWAVWAVLGWSSGKAIWRDQDPQARTAGPPDDRARRDRNGRATQPSVGRSPSNVWQLPPGLKVDKVPAKTD